MSRSRVINLANFESFQAINVLSDAGAIPGPVQIPSCAQIVLNWTTDSGRGAHQVWYGRYSGSFAGTVTQANAIHTALTTGTAWTNLATTIAPSNALAGVSIRDVNTVNQPIISSTTAAVPGTGTPPAMPLEMAACVTLRTAFVGPANRGRSYIPGWTTNATVVGNVISPTVVPNITAWISTWSSILSAQGYTFVLGQKARQQYTGSTGRVHPARAATSTPITAVLLRDNHWDSQRRRGLK